MEGDTHYKFKQVKRAGRCPVLFCRRDSRPASRGGPYLHRLCPMHAKQLSRLRDPAKALFYEMRSNAKTRGKDWSLTIEQFRSIVAQQDYLDGRGCTKQCLHLDRIDNTRGYHFDNIQIITCSENVAKGNAERRRAYAGAPPLPEDDNCPF